MHPHDTTTEEWRPIPEYEGLYSVSNYGRVRREIPVHRHLKPVATVYGYTVVSLSWYGLRQTHKIHRLVTAAFLGPCPDNMEVNHMDRVKSNNNLSNLEYI